MRTALSAPRAGVVSDRVFQHIQLLRFVAAAAVVLFHANASAAFYLEEEGLAALQYGKYGVDLFFVISGFVIYLTAREESDARAFLARRIRRIVPLYWLITIALPFAAALGLSASTDWTDPARLTQSLAFVSFSQGNWPVLYVGWSVEFEMVFYVLTALSIAVSRRPWDVLLCCLSFLVVLGAPPLLLEFTFDVLVGQFLVSRQIPWAGVAVLAILLYAPNERVIFAGIPAAAIVALAVAADLRRRQRKISGTLLTFGDASYSIYLVHTLMISAAAKAMLALSPTMTIGLMIPILAAAGLLCGLLTYYYVERPIHHGLLLNRPLRFPSLKHR
jgi:exopolysaccharide production protein ExoZ